jgi:hypothetical protein
MKSRTQLPQSECAVRSRLCQILHEQDLIAGSLVTMRRVCGKPTCRCARGEKHESLYLALSVKGKRTMVIVARERVEAVTAAVEAYKRVSQLQKKLSEECFARLMLATKE